MSLNFLLVFIPIALGLNWYGANPIAVFATSALAIVPLTNLIGAATENVAAHLGPTLGGLINATMGNVPEMVIGGFALSKGLQTVVKASITGSLLGNVLFILGLSMVAGGTRYRTLKYNVYLAGLNAKLLLLAVVALVVPALFHFTTQLEDRIGFLIALILLLSYAASLAFTLFTHRQLFTGKPQAEGPVAEGRRPWSIGKAAGVLAVTALLLAVMSEVLTDAVEPTARGLGLTPTFAGIFLLATVGNVSGLINAVQFARRDNMDLAVGVTLGAGAQVALLVAPVLVFAGLALGRPMDLLFSRFEVAAIIIAVVVAREITSDGESNWIEGVMLIAVYATLGVGFFYLRP